MDPAELEKERNVILEELASVEDSPGELAGILIDETLWPDQPLGRNIGGTPDSVKSLPLSSVNRYLADQYVPENIVLAVAGNVNHDEIVEAANHWLGDWVPRKPGPWLPVRLRNDAPRLAVREKETEQAHICIAFETVPVRHPDRYAVDLLSALLGDGMSSRLFLELREERALVYDIHTYPSEFRDTGSFTIYAGCDPENARTTAEVTMAEIEKLFTTMSVAEFAKAKQMARGRMQLRMEDTRAVAGWIGSQELLLDEIKTVDEIVECIDAVTADDVLRVGRTLLQPSRAVIAAVGPFESDATFAGII